MSFSFIISSSLTTEWEHHPLLSFIMLERRIYRPAGTSFVHDSRVDGTAYLVSHLLISFSKLVMGSAELIVTRFTELLASGQVDKASAYLADDVILQSWLGVVEGKADVVSYLNDNKRFMHHARTSSAWRQVNRSMEQEAETDPSFSSGYDHRNFAVFERVGTIATRPRFSVKTELVRETVVVRNDFVVLFVLAKRGI